MINVDCGPHERYDSIAMKQRAIPTLLIFLSMMIMSVLRATDKPAGEYIEEIPRGFINWSERRIYAMGVGAPGPGHTNITIRRLEAEKTAKTTMKRNFIRAIRRLRLYATVIIGTNVSPVALRNISSDIYFDDIQTVSQDYYSDGTVNVLAAMPFSSAFTMVGDKITVPYDPAVVPVKTTPHTDGTIRALIIDLRSFSFKPVLLLTVRSDNGTPLITPEMLQECGNKVFPSWITDITYARALIKTPDALMTVRPEKVQDNTTVVLSPDDMRKIRERLTADTNGVPRIFMLVNGE